MFGQKCLELGDTLLDSRQFCEMFEVCAVLSRFMTKLRMKTNKKVGISDI